VKGDCILHLADLVAHLDGMQIVVLPPDRFPPRCPHPPARSRRARAASRAGGLCPAVALPALGLAPGARLEDLLAHSQAGAPGRVWLGATMHRRGDDARRLARLQAIARARVPVLAVNDALFARRCDKPCRM
jgi:error-prone DNA polymerase